MGGWRLAAPRDFSRLHGWCAPTVSQGEKGYFRIKLGEGGIDNECIASAADAKYTKHKPGPGPTPACDKMLDDWCHDEKGQQFQCMTCLEPHLKDFLAASCPLDEAVDFCGL